MFPNIRSSALAASLAVLAFSPPSLYATGKIHHRSLNSIGVQQLPPSPRLVEFQQITFEYDGLDRIADSDWGWIRIDPKGLLKFSRACEGYVNVFISDPAGGLSWVVDNVFVQGPDSQKCSGTDEKGLEVARRNDPFLPDRRRSFHGRPDAPAIPVYRYFDLRPGMEGEGPMRWLSAVVWFSKAPVPNADEFLKLAAGSRTMRYRVTQAVENAGGDLYGADERFRRAPRQLPDEDDTSNPGRAIPGPSKLVIGPPPQAVRTRPLAELGHIGFVLGTFQSSTVNVNAAWNQCVPAAHANALAYLEQRYNFNPNIWDLPQHHVRGIGKVTPGDIPFYEPVPPWSIVANVDFFTQRKNVFDLNTGGGTGGCANLIGLLKYINAFTDDAPVAQVRHQGWGNNVVGDNDFFCDPTGGINLGGLQSQPEGEAPTWEWIRDQLQAGRSVVVGWGRFDPDGDWIGGHKVRVYGAATYNNKRYLYMLDDLQQGDNFEGLRTFSYEVTDDHTPGDPGVPNGFLEADSMVNFEFVNAVSVEAQPKFIFD